MAYVFILADALDEEDAQLGLPSLDAVDQQLSPVDGAVGRVEDADRATLVQEIV